MLQGLLRYWCFVLVCSTMFSSAFYIRSSSSQLVPRLHSLTDPIELDHHPSQIAKRSLSDKNYGSFYRLMARHNRYKDEQAFVEKMFRLFDMNSDQVIERDEFKAILQLLGIISHSY